MPLTPTPRSTTARLRARSLAGVAAAAAVALTLPAVANAQFGSLGSGSAGLVDTGSVPPDVLFPPEVGVGAGEGVEVVEGPGVAVTTVLDQLNIPWDVVRTPDGTILTGERGGRMVAQLPGGARREVGIDLTGLVHQSESGLVGLAVDAGFAQNREIHVCWSRDAGGTRDNRVTTFRAADDWSEMTRVRDTLTGMPLGAEGIHSGCRLLTAPDGSIYIGTGDTYSATGPQSLESLAGKTLHINPDGSPATGDSVIHTIGHRNVQGLAIQPGTGRLYSAEHGPDVDDEVNLLERGANYGWNPNVDGSYNQNVPMTDTAGFPDAVEAVWSSGEPTLASADIEFLQGSGWGEWEGALAMANLKTQKLVLLRLSDDGRSVEDAAVLLEGEFGRLRSLMSEPDGSLLVTTSDADNQDEVFRVSPAAL
ncbi:PQQ-dependent sugar dehydrogenase [Dietzia sp. PP-33]|uniref:PQQ-dependent sugar dehydrogenase n=1 Tax=Dietzia sp. PP-33 TaxID=2957500 RepID=UPI0029A7EDEC|nr:PQQ-dependent sugar dehydrogenase [Dietzia sp. PP-33]MDX2356263.1 PQQ-dependent sugar dehydrogenase [Dietzia sp. PP-33]